MKVTFRLPIGSGTGRTSQVTPWKNPPFTARLPQSSSDVVNVGKTVRRGTDGERILRLKIKRA
ncbi:MAG TPA: hypothetical protein VF944_00155 [Candidatus Bathyarchaeia archaeon]